MYLKYVIALYINVLIAVFLVKTKALKKNPYIFQYKWQNKNMP